MSLRIKQLTQSLFYRHLKMQFSIIYTVVQHLKHEKVESLSFAAQVTLAEGFNLFIIVFPLGTTSWQGSQTWNRLYSVMHYHPLTL